MSPELLLKESHRSLKKFGLCYVSDEEPGILRRRCGRGFSYIYADGRKLKQSPIISRIKSLAVPPAWEDVWICKKSNGHLQATGTDQKRRKQYLYHTQWFEMRQGLRFKYLSEFAVSLPKIRGRVGRSLRIKKLNREKLLAAAVRILDQNHFRIGHSSYRSQNNSFGLSTLLKKHVEVNGSVTHFSFTGKKGVHREAQLKDEAVASVIRECQDIPGRHLFSYHHEDGTVMDIESSDINEWIHEVSGAHWTAKDFRTWWGSVHSFKHLSELEMSESTTGRKKQVIGAVKETAEALGNTPAVARKYYIHPKILEDFEAGHFRKIKKPPKIRGLKKIEREFLAYIQA